MVNAEGGGARARRSAGADLDSHKDVLWIERNEVHLTALRRAPSAGDHAPATRRQPGRHGILGSQPERVPRISHLPIVARAHLPAAYRAWFPWRHRPP